ncbi:hypothetical protein AB0M95_23245 [Sphaerisporangium sp. NPDC051017]|uniref:hypothetical protein n=1 Tax=Sphaerisporangium sp. NPDC051017 TaxID=3154636 RepID=UPI00342665B4
MRRSSRILVAAFACVLFGVTACGPTKGIEESVTEPSYDTIALDSWRDFPVTHKPRPLVLVSNLPLRSDEKTTLGSGFELAGPLPAQAPPRATVNLPDGPATLPVVMATEAFTAMTGHTGRPAGPSVKVISATYTTSSFATDRGPVDLPAWRFATETAGTATWPALSPAAFWQLGKLRASGDVSQASVSGDGHVLTARVARPGHWCPGNTPQIEPVVIESPASVAVGLRFTFPQPQQRCVVPADAVGPEESFSLTNPLNERVVLDLGGYPVTVH